METDSDWANQVEEEFKEEEADREARMLRELHRRLTHEATGPLPRVRALCAIEGRDETEFSVQPGTIITIHRLSKASVGWMYGTLDGKEGCVWCCLVEILD